MFLVLLIALALAAILYGAFFLVFKLIWILLKKKSNLWPLVLAGITTIILAIAAMVVVYRGYNYLIKPFSPIIQEVQLNPEPVYGEKTYTDEQFGFTMTQYDGTVFSNWIYAEEAAFLFGIDTNQLKGQEVSADTLTGFFLMHAPNTAHLTAQQLSGMLKTQMQQLTANEVHIEITDEFTPVDVGANGTGAITDGYVSAATLGQPIPGMILIAAREQDVFYLLGLGNNQEEIQDTLYSFHLTR